MQAGTNLPEQHGTAEIQSEHDGRHRHDGAQEQKRGAGHRRVEGALGDGTAPASRDGGIENGKRGQRALAGAELLLIESTPACSHRHERFVGHPGQFERSVGKRLRIVRLDDDAGAGRLDQVGGIAPPAHENGLSHCQIELRLRRYGDAEQRVVLEMHQQHVGGYKQIADLR